MAIRCEICENKFAEIDGGEHEEDAFTLCADCAYLYTVLIKNNSTDIRKQTFRKLLDQARKNRVLKE